MKQYLKILCLYLILTNSARAQPDLQVEISKQRLIRDLFFLASNSLEGRKFPFQGREIAANYIANEFKIIGLHPINKGEKGYFQRIPVLKLDNGTAELKINSIWHNQGNKFIFASKESFTDSLSFPVRYWGENLPHGHNFGDTVIHIFNKNLDEALHRVDIISASSSANTFVISLPKRKAQREILRQYGVISSHHYPRSITKNKSLNDSFYFKIRENENDLRVFLFPEKSVELLYGKSTKKLNGDVKRSIRTGKANQGIISDLTFNVDYRLEIDSLFDDNVIGYIEGTDLRDEIIIVCGHYDHLGRSENEIFNGADDNASGTAGVIELARMCAQAQSNGFEFRRSIVFIALAAEESGLYGSFYYVNNPHFPLEKTVIVINMDMIGRPENNPKYSSHTYSWPVKGHKRQIRKAIRIIDKQMENIRFYTRKNFPQNIYSYFGSDHYPFVRKGVPAIFVCTEMHNDYHKPTDTAEKINYENMANILKGIFVVIIDVANEPNKYPIKSR